MLREDFGPADSTELWTHFNQITHGVNEIGQTARYWMGDGSATDKYASVLFPSNQNVAPALNIAGRGLARSTTMANPPARAAGGRRLVFPEGGPYRVVWRAAWNPTTRGGSVSAGIQLNPSDAGQDQIGSLTGQNLGELWYSAVPFALAGTPGANAAAAVAEVSIDFDFEPGDSIMLWTRNETGGDLGLRPFELWTYATITRIGH